jgi:putative flippase GtrA
MFNVLLLWVKIMKENLKKLFYKYKEIILYCIFGGLTTIINIIAYFIFSRFFNVNYLVSNIIAWVLSVLFAYVTNKTFVFQSRNTEVKYVIKELIAFIGSRLFSGVLDFGIMYVFVDVLSFNDFIIKIIANVIVIVINYIFSKLMVFKK